MIKADGEGDTGIGKSGIERGNKRAGERYLVKLVTMKDWMEEQRKGERGDGNKAANEDGISEVLERKEKLRWRVERMEEDLTWKERRTKWTM
ncbi:hypothetical protein KM043_017103 [Ampulex compressa]|nr:hypothetical protein KM043_017103 [Ampulex compressa]